ncbi:MAG: radical SAM protein [Candidatus Hodarchaeales archaeon]
MKLGEYYSECRICGQRPEIFSSFIGICPNCTKTRKKEASKLVEQVHSRSRKIWGLSEKVPRSLSKRIVICNLCSNKCQILEGNKGFCGVWENKKGKLTNSANNCAFIHTYLDPLPTNCCNSYFCSESHNVGYYNLACFFYGCNFSCLGCQNDQHRNLSKAGKLTIDGLVRKVINDTRISCICFFGGSPEPQLPYAIRASQKILKVKDPNRNIRICWEWNGAGNEKLVERAVKLSLESGGNAKFDLKCFSNTLSEILHAVPNIQSFKNFKRCYEKFYNKRRNSPVISGTTLLVPEYVDKNEVRQIAKFIANLDKNILYSLLVFHPDSLLFDLPITPKDQVEECFNIAKEYLENVHIGNKNLLSYSI